MAPSGLDVAAYVGSGGDGGEVEVAAGPCEKAGLAVGAGEEGPGVADVGRPSVTEWVAVRVGDITDVYWDNIVVVVGGPS